MNEYAEFKAPNDKIFAAELQKCLDEAIKK
jgi:hypothetical protein